MGKTAAVKKLKKDFISLNPCACDRCSSHTVLHWYCSVCGQGPLAFKDRQPWYRRFYRVGDKEGVYGTEYACNKFCYGRLDTAVERPAAKPRPLAKASGAR